MYMIDAAMLGTDATDDDAREMVAILTDLGYNVEFGAGENDDPDYVPDTVWQRCLAMIGTSSAAATLGRKGGRTSTDAKAAAARENGKKGGRPPAHRFTVLEGSYSGTTDDVLGTWYVHDRQGRGIEKIGRGYATKREAMAEARRLNEEHESE